MRALRAPVSAWLKAMVRASPYSAASKPGFSSWACRVALASRSSRRMEVYKGFIGCMPRNYMLKSIFCFSYLLNLQGGVLVWSLICFGKRAGAYLRRLHKNQMDEGLRNQRDTYRGTANHKGPGRPGQDLRTG